MLKTFGIVEISRVNGSFFSTTGVDDFIVISAEMYRRIFENKMYLLIGIKGTDECHHCITPFYQVNNIEYFRGDLDLRKFKFRIITLEDALDDQRMFMINFDFVADLFP